MSVPPRAAWSTSDPSASLVVPRPLPRRRSTTMAAFTALCLGSVLAYVYVAWYPRTGDVAPDSVYGYGFAIAGTGLLLMVGIGYSVRKRWRHHTSGHPHTLLAWHMAGALLGLVLVLMHVAGNFNPRSGTYALYVLVGVVVSGIIGQALGRYGRWQAARAQSVLHSNLKSSTRAIQSPPQYELLSLQLMRTWRHVHTLLSAAFLGLLVWHLIYVATLLVHAR
jgi:hypothetical protein